MSVEIAPEETSIRIPRVCIHIPGIHSREKLEPRYVFPLFKAMWKDSMRDPSDTVRITEMPPNIPDNDKFRVLPLAGAMEYESSRLRAEFGLHPKTQEPWFDHVYPGDTFAAAFDAAAKDAAVSTGSQTSTLTSVTGIDAPTAQRLAAIGVYDLKTLAGADVEKLTKVLGRTKAESAREDAQFKLNPAAHEPKPTEDAKLGLNAVVPQKKA